MSTFRIRPRGPYALAASAKFLCGFTPGSGTSTVLPDGRLALGFLSDWRFEPLVVALAEEGGAIVGASSTSGDPRAIARQVARILSLDHDARGLAEVGARDPVVARLLAESPGFRPVCFPSPYEAAVWGVLAQRVTMRVAAANRRRLAIATGTRVTAFGQDFHPAPPPARMLALTRFEGIADEKIRRLHAVARAALAGTLDAERLVAMPEERALAELSAIRGVGPWTAAHVLLRGCGVADALPAVEPRVLQSAALAYGLGDRATMRDLARVSEAWRPYRMWISVLLVSSVGARVGRDQRRSVSQLSCGA